ncbi:MAG: hypothetical protein HY072_03770 [Deltaproteobacteria bacterium]|nr:hypothetical protein [Deltaproteobacteria bacterium]
MLWSIFWSDPTFHTLNNTKATNSLLRIDVILLLVLPQIALTLANSVIGTKDVVNRYYGKIKHRVEINNLLYSIGFGNIISALVGGLPFCHGSGGVTAHYRGGANHFISNLIMGVFLLFLAFIYLKNGQWLLNYPLPFTAILLIATGIFHLNLARPTWETKYGKIKLFLATCVAIFLFFHKTTH